MTVALITAAFAAAIACIWHAKRAQLTYYLEEPDEARRAQLLHTLAENGRVRDQLEHTHPTHK